MPTPSLQEPSADASPRCERCFQPIRDPTAHGLYRCPYEPRPAVVRYFQDQVPGGLVVENLAPVPLMFDSHSEKRKYMKRHGIREHVQCVDGDRHLKR